MSQQINLYNPLFRKAGFSPTSATAMLYGLGAAVALAALYGVYQDSRTQEMARRAQNVSQQLADATALRDKLAAQLSQQKPNAELATELSRLEARLKGRQDVVEALNSGVIGTTSGFSEYMRAFSRQTVNGLWLTGFDIASAGDEFEIEGRALSADLLPNYLQRLNSEKALHGRQFAALRISQPKPEPVTPVASATQPAEATKGAADAKSAATADLKVVAPRYLEFTISARDVADPAQKAAVPAPRTSAAGSRN